jgi:hypothetical protein
MAALLKMLKLYQTSHLCGEFIRDFVEHLKSAANSFEFVMIPKTRISLGE